MPTLEPPTDKPDDRSWARLPSQTVFALVEGEAEAEAAKQRLMRAGIDVEQIRVLAGPDGAAMLDPDREDGVLPRFLSRALSELTDETRFVASYARQLREGRALIAVGYEADEKETAKADRMTIEAILIDSGGVEMSYTSDWTITGVGKGGPS